MIRFITLHLDESNPLCCLSVALFLQRPTLNALVYFMVLSLLY